MRRVLIYIFSLLALLILGIAILWLGYSLIWFLRFLIGLAR